MSTRLRVRSALILTVMLLAAACAGTEAAEGPPDINYGRDVCFECGMIISEERFASAYRLADGTEKLFDDIGGMLKHGHSEGEITAADVWVHDYETEAWVTADQAFFIVTRSIATPMAFGIISFDDKTRAEAVAHGLDADVVGWDVILSLPPDDLKTIAHSHDDDDHGMGDDHEASAGMTN